ncbi:KDP operon transcriptional regulatory protein KdpE [Rickettsiales bacterium Ac37b]|nr:KDP operon transcriptional regulatory protein KdpE [Rickettsiales bacterium Ac37b]
MRNIKSTVLISDTIVQMRKLLRNALQSAGYRTIEAGTGKETLRLSQVIKPELVLLDLTFSDISSVDIIAKIRARSQYMPIIATLEQDNDSLILDAFSEGIDDYIIKPFNIHILAAKVKAALRTAKFKELQEIKLELGEIIMDLEKHEVRKRGEIVQLSPKEYNLLAYLIQNKGKMLTHTQILNKVWGPSHSYDTQYLRVYIGQLRKKLEMKPTSPYYIRTEVGIGYRMERLAVNN